MFVNLTIGSKSYQFKKSSDMISELENGTAPAFRNNSLKAHMTIADTSTGEPNVHLLSKGNHGNRENPKRKGNMASLGSRFCQFANRKMGFNDPGVTYIDIYSRLLFPLGYASFLVVYFVIYLF